MNLVKTESDLAGKPRRPEDPVLSMLGVGQQLWEHEAGDRFVDRLRMEDPPASPNLRQSNDSAADLAETVWHGIQKYQG